MHKGLLPELIGAALVVLLVFAGIGWTFYQMYEAGHPKAAHHYNQGPQDSVPTG